MDIVVTGRRCQIPESLEERVHDKLSMIEKFRDKVQRVEVQFTASSSHGHQEAVTAEITLVSKGPAVRAVGQAEDKQQAFDTAFEKLKVQLRKAADRRKNSKTLRSTGLSEAFVAEFPTNGAAPAAPPAEETEPERVVAGDVTMTGDGPLVVREKQFDGTPLTLAQALDEMELVGHDFFLYVDAETQAPSVVYRRRGYDYGVIHLKVS